MLLPNNKSNSSADSLSTFGFETSSHEDENIAMLSEKDDSRSYVSKDTKKSRKNAVTKERRPKNPGASMKTLPASKHTITSDMLSEAKDKRILHLGEFKDVFKSFITQKAYDFLMKEQKKYPANSPFRILSTPELLDQPPSLSKACTLRDYQLKGLTWLVSQHEKRVGSILADEMGLGKTLQTISFIAHQLHVKKEKGPFLVVVPLSVMFNWMQEFSKWCPSIKVVKLHSNDENEIKRVGEIIRDATKTEVIVTTYDVVKAERTKRILSGIIYNTVILDEGHRIKNRETHVATSCRALRAQWWLILTGTPVQNNMHESWVMLNFLVPDIFTKSEVFDESFDIGNEKIDRELLKNAHYVMRPFVLRRLKNEVEQKLPPRIETKISCPMTSMQRFWIQHLLYKQRDAMAKAEQDLSRSSGNALAKRLVRTSDADRDSGLAGSLSNLLASLRKACNHPYLFPGVESVQMDGQPTAEIVNCSGKMVVLEKLVMKLIGRGHRIVIFSQFTRVLDIISDYFSWKQIDTKRLDGSTNRVMREVLINDFNKPKSKCNVFLLSTRAGGEGVNLTSADTVILYDSDWNPQVDNQAMARVHRIGQTKTVHVYRLVIAGSVEERILQRAQKKLFLDGMVNRGSTNIAKAMDEKKKAKKGRGKGGDDDDKEEGDEEPDEDDIFSILKFGWNSAFGDTSNSHMTITDSDIELIIDRNRGLKEGGATFSGTVVAETEEERGAQQAFEERLREDQQLGLDDFDEKTPLVNIRDFEGKNSYLGSSKDLASVYREQQALIIKGKRKRKDRMETVEIEGVGDVMVLKSEVEGAGDKEKGDEEEEVWEEDPEKAKEKKRREEQNELINVLASRSKKQVAGRDYKHQDHCQNCWDGGEILCCDACPAAYHTTCLAEVPNSRGKWMCPHHSCAQCDRKALAAGLLFRCDVCPSAYCEDCLAALKQNEVQIIGTSPSRSALGYNNPSSACYIVCSLLCAQYALDEKLPVADCLSEDMVALALTGVDSSGSPMHGSPDASNQSPSRNLPVIDLDFLDSCKLTDIYVRLNRMHLSQTEVTCRYGKLSDIFGFNERWESATAGVKSVLLEVLKAILAPFNLNIESFIATKDGNKDNEDNDDVDQEAINEKRWLEVQSAIFNFPGIPLPSLESSLDGDGSTEGNNDNKGHTTFVPEIISDTTMERTAYNANMVDACSAAVRTLATTNVNTLRDMANLLCVCQMQLVAHNQRDVANWTRACIPENNFPLREPKFRHYGKDMMGGSRSKLEEAIACFLVTLLPINHLVNVSSSKGKEKKDDDERAPPPIYDLGQSVLYVGRFLESFQHSLWDPSGTRYFTGLSTRKVQWCQEWEIHVGALDAYSSNRSLVVARKLFASATHYNNRMIVSRHATRSNGKKEDKDKDDMEVEDGKEVIYSPSLVPREIHILLANSFDEQNLLRFYNLQQYGAKKDSEEEDSGTDTDESEGEGGWGPRNRKRAKKRALDEAAVFQKKKQPVNLNPAAQKEHYEKIQAQLMKINESNTPNEWVDLDLRELCTRYTNAPSTSGVECQALAALLSKITSDRVRAFKTINEFLPTSSRPQTSAMSKLIYAFFCQKASQNLHEKFPNLSKNQLLELQVNTWNSMTPERRWNYAMEYYIRRNHDQNFLCMSQEMKLCGVIAISFESVPMAKDYEEKIIATNNRQNKPQQHDYGTQSNGQIHVPPFPSGPACSAEELAIYVNNFRYCIKTMQLALFKDLSFYTERDKNSRSRKDKSIQDLFLPGIQDRLTTMSSHIRELCNGLEQIKETLKTLKCTLLKEDAGKFDSANKECIYAYETVTRSFRTLKKLYENLLLKVKGKEVSEVEALRDATHERGEGEVQGQQARNRPLKVIPWQQEEEIASKRDEMREKCLLRLVNLFDLDVVADDLVATKNLEFKDVPMNGAIPLPLVIRYKSMAPTKDHRVMFVRKLEMEIFVKTKTFELYSSASNSTEDLLNVLKQCDGRRYFCCAYKKEDKS